MTHKVINFCLSMSAQTSFDCKNVYTLSNPMSFSHMWDNGFLLVCIFNDKKTDRVKSYPTTMFTFHNYNTNTK